MKLTQEIISFLKNQGFVIVSTLDPTGAIHCSAKGIADISDGGKICLIDLYKTKTFTNIKSNPTITITAIDEHAFLGFALSGKAYIVEREKIKDYIIKEWEDKVINRISNRVIKNIKNDKSSTQHPESYFPSPQYLIEMDVEEAIDLAPACLKRPAR